MYRLRLENKRIPYCGAEVRTDSSASELAYQ
jgi:hypothetical protein